jgi:hypothetical protein
MVLEYGPEGQESLNGDGLLYTSTDSGATWNSLWSSSPANLWSCVASSADGHKLAAAGSLSLPTGELLSGDGLIHTSTNAGATWMASSAPSLNWVSLASSADGSKLGAASSSYWYGTNFIEGAIYCSADFGTTWVRTTAPNIAWSSIASSADGAKLNALGGGQLYASSDSGATWTALTAPTNLPPPACASWSLAAFTSSADGTRLVAAWVASGGFVSPYFGLEEWVVNRIYLSADSGATWTLTGAPNEPWDALASSADGYKVVVAGNQSVCLLPYLGPWRWTGAYEQSFDSVASSADGSRLVAAEEFGPVCTSTDSGATWTATPAETGGFTAVASSADGAKLLAALSGYQLQVSSDSGASWTAGGPINFRSSVASSVDGTKLVAASQAGGGGAVGPPGIYLSADSGRTWALTSAPGSMFWYSLASSADGTKLVAAAQAGDVAGSGRIHLSAGSGMTWTQASAPSNNWVSVASSASGSNLVAVASSDQGGDGLIYTSGDAGVSWGPASVPANNWLSVAASGDGTRLVAIGAGVAEVAYISTNSGATWASVEPPAGAAWSAIACSADGNTVIAVGGPIGILHWPLPAPPPPSPRLSICSTGAHPVVSWLLPSTSFVLQQNSDLTSPTWVDLTNQPTLNFSNLHNQVTLPVPTGNAFFRLKGQ